MLTEERGGLDTASAGLLSGFESSIYPLISNLTRHSNPPRLYLTMR